MAPSALVPVRFRRKTELISGLLIVSHFGVLCFGPCYRVGWVCCEVP